MIPAPEDLYTPAVLFDAWSATDPGSWANSYDGRVYRQAVADGLRAPERDEVAEARARHDTAITRRIHDRVWWDDTCRPAAIMGGHAAERGSTTYRSAARLGAGLADAGLTVMTGGGPGAMEAAHLGARLGPTSTDVDAAIARIAHEPSTRAFPLGANALLTADGSYDPDAIAALHRWQVPAFELADETAADAAPSIGIPTWLYGHEPPTPLATAHAKYFENSIREDGLLALAVHGIVYLPGSAGTLQEVFQDAAQNHYRTVRGIFSPMVFFDIDGHWTERLPIRPVLEALFDPDDWARVLFTRDVDEAVAFLDDFAVPAGMH